MEQNNRFNETLYRVISQGYVAYPGKFNQAVVQLKAAKIKITKKKEYVSFKYLEVNMTLLPTTPNPLFKQAVLEFPEVLPKPVEEVKNLGINIPDVKKTFWKKLLFWKK